MEEEKEIFDRKRKVALFTLVGAMALTLGIVTYAYFGTEPTNDNPLTIDATTGNLSLIFRDGTSETAPVTGTLNFGDHITKYFELENNGSLDAYAQINFANLINTYTSKSLRYELKYRTATTGDYTETTNTVSKNVPVSETASTKPLAKGILIPAETTYYYELTITLDYLDDVDQTSDLNARFQSTFSIEEGQAIFNVKNAVIAMQNHQPPAGIITKAPTASEFSAGVTSNTEGVYAMADDYTSTTGNNSYYYRGAVTNNYVKFGTNSAGAAMYWRIIRVNGDGSVRMIYDGTQAYENRNGADTYQANNADRFIKTGQKFNAKYNDAKYVGYKYGGVAGVASTSKSQAEGKDTDSDIKVEVEKWYAENLSDEDKYLADGTFCIDRSISATPNEWVTWEAALSGSQDLRGYGANNTVYGAYGRFYGSTRTNTPQFTCSRDSDKLTVANGGLSKKIGLITADEIVAAGVGPGSNNYYYYLNKSSSYRYWSLSPSSFNYGYAFVFGVNSYGSLNDYGVSYGGAVAPVINLSAEYAKQLIGTGKIGDEYKLSTGQ